MTVGVRVMNRINDRISVSVRYTVWIRVCVKLT